MFRVGALLLAMPVIVILLDACTGILEKLDEQDSGRTVELRIGTKLEVVLSGNPTTGYQWEVSSVDATILKQLGEPQFKPDSSAIGSGGKITWHFEAMASGETTLQLIYRRSWENGAPPQKTFEAVVIVK